MDAHPSRRKYWCDQATLKKFQKIILIWKNKNNPDWIWVTSCNIIVAKGIFAVPREKKKHLNCSALLVKQGIKEKIIFYLDVFPLVILF